MAFRIVICFPIGDAPGLRAEAAQLALGLAACGHEVQAIGQLGGWRHPLRQAKIVATEFTRAGEERKLRHTIQEAEPQIIHAFGAEMAHLTLPLTVLVGAGGVATLGHDDLAGLVPAHFRTASVVFVPCEFLREQLTRRLPAVSVAQTGYLLPPSVETSSVQQRFLMEELGIPDGAPLVVMADHFHGGETEVAATLIAATPLIAQRVEGLQVIIAGQGVRLGELEQQAIEVNTQLGYRAVLLPGHRDDLAQILSLATVAVGSGRFAMEAVGAGVALVAAGAAGMLGTFTDESAQVAQFACCGRHGHLEPVTVRALSSEIIGLFDYPEYRARFASEGQARVLETAERTQRAAQIAAYYERSAPTGAIGRTPQRLTAILPDDLRELLFTLPAISSMRAHFPLARVTLAAAFEHCRLLRQLEIAGRVLEKPRHFHHWPSFLRAMLAPREDVCLSFARDLHSALLTGSSCAPHRVGYTEGAGNLFFTDHLPARNVPISPARALTLMHSLGIAASAEVGKPVIPPEVQEVVNLSLLSAGIEYTDRLILLCPRGDDLWSWPKDHWEALCRLLVADGGSEKIAVLDAEEMVLPDEVIPISPVQESLTLAALLTRAALVIAPDHGPLHLADLLRLPTIGLYGPTSPDICLPNEQRRPLCHREYPCHPCVDTTCDERHCLCALTPEEVAGAVSAWRGVERKVAVPVGAGEETASTG